MVDNGTIDQNMMDDIIDSNHPLVQKIDDKGNVTLETPELIPWRKIK